MHRSIGVVRKWQLVRSDGDAVVMHAASLVKQVIGHLALELIEDLDEPVFEDITVRHVLTRTTGLPNWRPHGQPLEPLRPPGTVSSCSKDTFSGEAAYPSSQWRESACSGLWEWRTPVSVIQSPTSTVIGRS